MDRFDYTYIYNRYEFLVDFEEVDRLTIVDKF